MKEFKELIQPYCIEEQQGVYIPLIDKVLLKDNVPAMRYDDFMKYEKTNGVQIATKDELLQMYLQKDEINKVLREHNGDMLDTCFVSSSEYDLVFGWVVNFGSGSCFNTGKTYSDVSRAVVDLKTKTNNKTMEQFNLAEYLKNPNRKIVTRDGRPVRIICTDRKGSLKHPHPIVALVQIDDTEPIYDYTADGSYTDDTQSLRDLFFVTEKQESPLKKGDRVLVRNYDNESWRPRIFSSYDSYDKECKYKYECEGDDDKYIQCIPYNEHTWKLLGTTDEYKEENMKQHSKKKTGWANVYKYYGDTPIIGEVHDTKEKAMSIINQTLTYVDTIKIKWHEE